MKYTPYLSLLCSAVVVQAAIATAKPNFIFILVDDMGWTGTSVPMSPTVSPSSSDFYQTPNIEKLAKQGMVFSNAYAPAPMCTPSRASFLTGKSPAQLHITSPGPAKKASSWQKVEPAQHSNSLSTNEVTIAELLQKNGYATAHFGKWHLSGGGPGHHGFDVHDGETANGGPGVYEAPNPKDISGITERAISFMSTKAKAKKSFYLQLSHYAVHSPSLANPETKQFLKKETKGERHYNTDYAAMTKDFDSSVGEIMKSLKTLNLTDNTYLIFMSDNGPGRRNSRQENAPLAGGKGSLWEGGIRVPLIISGPKVKPKTTCSTNVVGFDLFKTIYSLASLKTKIPSGIEGVSLVTLLTQKGSFKRPNNSIIFHFPHYGKGPKQVPQSAILVGNIKLIKNYDTGEYLLFNLASDPGETKNLAKKEASTTNKMIELLNNTLSKLKAQIPTVNTDYDSSATTPRRRK